MWCKHPQLRSTGVKTKKIQDKTAKKIKLLSTFATQIQCTLIFEYLLNKNLVGDTEF